MTTGIVPASAIPTPPTQTNVKQQFSDKDGNLTNSARIALQQLHDYVQNMSRRFPCNASTANNVITLTLLNIQPSLTQYADYDDFVFVADTTTTGNVTAKVVATSGALATLNVYKNNGASQAGSSDITQGRQYAFTFVDSLNSGAGGFVMR